MRIAVALPSLEPQSPQGLCLDATLAALSEDDVDIEGFAEHDRLRRREPFAAFHYLRMRERHAARPFDLALYPLGRDAGPFQSALGLMQQFPGVAWFLDPVIHHLAVGGIAFFDAWADYREMLEAGYPGRGAAIAQTVASHWGTGALFRTYDLVGATGASQPGLLSAWSSLGEHVASRLEGRDVGVAPLARLDSLEQSLTQEAVTDVPLPIRSEEDGGLPVVAIMTVNESRVATAIDAAGAVLAMGSERGAAGRVVICVSEPVFATAAGPAADRAAIGDRIDWVLSPSPARLAEVAGQADVALWLSEDLQGAHRPVLLRTMSAGKVTVVPRRPLYADLPEGAVAALDLGTSLAPSLRAFLEAVADDSELRAGLVDCGRDFALSEPDAKTAAGLLRGRLDDLAGSCSPRDTGVAASTWEKVAASMAAAAAPGGVDGARREPVNELLDPHTSPFRR